jgi:ribosomal-protein-alanine N-acetyltransferase
MTNTVYKSITSEDVESLMAIENICHSHPWSEKTLRSCIGGRYFGFSLSVEQTTVGFYIGEYVASQATLMDICVIPAQRGNSYGRFLLEHFLACAKSKGATENFLEVRAKNISALMMYINQGFVEIDRRSGYYPSDMGYEDAIVMKKTD